MYNPVKTVEDLKARREAKGYTVADLSRIAGVGYHTIKRAEEGKPVRGDIYRWIEDALNG